MNNDYIAVPNLGSKLTLISNVDIRYEGVLCYVNTTEGTIALKNVKAFGTENRRFNQYVAPSNKIYHCVVFKGKDIKELAMCESENKTPNPAILFIPVSNLESKYCLIPQYSNAGDNQAKNYVTNLSVADDFLSSQTETRTSNCQHNPSPLCSEVYPTFGYITPSFPLQSFSPDIHIVGNQSNTEKASNSIIDDGIASSIRSRMVATDYRHSLEMIPDVCRTDFISNTGRLSNLQSTSGTENFQSNRLSTRSRDYRSKSSIEPFMYHDLIRDAELAAEYPMSRYEIKPDLRLNMSYDPPRHNMEGRPSFSGNRKNIESCNKDVSSSGVTEKMHDIVATPKCSLDSVLTKESKISDMGYWENCEGTPNGFSMGYKENGRHRSSSISFGDKVGAGSNQRSNFVNKLNSPPVRYGSTAVIRPLKSNILDSKENIRRADYKPCSPPSDIRNYKANIYPFNNWSDLPSDTMNAAPVKANVSRNQEITDTNFMLSANHKNTQKADERKSRSRNSNVSAQFRLSGNNIQRPLAPMRSLIKPIDIKYQVHSPTQRREEVEGELEAKTSECLKFYGNFDFESSNSKFSKCGEKEQNDKVEVGYDKDKSFFDSFWCESVTSDRRVDREKQRLLDIETFGPHYTEKKSGFKRDSSKYVAPKQNNFEIPQIVYS